MIILKYQLPVSFGLHKVEMPVGFKILTVQEQHNRVTFWAETDQLDGDTHQVEFALLATGVPYPMKEEWKYLGTVQLFAGGTILVFHLYQTGRHIA